MSHTPVNRILLGAVVPVVLYYIGRKLGMPMAGAVTAGLWALGVMGWYWFKAREVDGFSGIGAAYAISELAGLAVTHDPDWYLLSPIISDWVLGGVFLVTMAFRKPLIQILSEQMAGLDAFPEAVRESRHYRPLWVRLSLLWGGAYLLRGATSWYLLNAAPVEVYLSAKVALGWPLITGLIALSFWYPKRYWRRVL